MSSIDNIPSGFCQQGLAPGMYITSDIMASSSVAIELGTVKKWEFGMQVRSLILLSSGAGRLSFRLIPVGTINHIQILPYIVCAAWRDDALIIKPVIYKPQNAYDLVSEFGVGTEHIGKLL